MRKKEIVFLIAFMLVFFIIFIIAMLDFIQGKAILDIGFSPLIINLIVIALSFFAIVKTIAHLHLSY